MSDGKHFVVMGIWNRLTKKFDENNSKIVITTLIKHANLEKNVTLIFKCLITNLWVSNMFALAAVLSAYSTRSLQALVIEGSKWLFRHFSRDLLLTIMYTPNCVISSIEENIP